MNCDFEQLWTIVTAQFHAPEYTVHGPDHWRRVERNGFLLATRSGADITVVRLFALFHDSRRENDFDDDRHGARGAEFAASLHGSAYHISSRQLELLRYACEWHTDGVHHEDPTIGTCWDADRLDLGRVGITPSAAFMSTVFGKEIADIGSLQPYLSSAGSGATNR